MHVVITGASQGIGAAIALAFARERNATLSLLARNETRLEKVASECREAGAEATWHAVDLTWDDQVEAVADTILENAGPPEVLVNNAGKFRPRTILDMDGALLRKQLEENIVSAHLVTQAFLPAMIELREGQVFFLGSVASLRAYPASAGYCAAKHGLLGLARAVREETKPHGLKVTTVLPGATLTPSWSGVDIPEHRFMPAEDVARAIVDCTRLGPRTVVEELLLRPQPGDV